MSSESDRQAKYLIDLIKQQGAKESLSPSQLQEITKSNSVSTTPLTYRYRRARKTDDTYPFKTVGVWYDDPVVVCQAGDRPSKRLIDYLDILGFYNRGKGKTDFVLLGEVGENEYRLKNKEGERDLEFESDKQLEYFKDYSGFYGDDFYGVVPLVREEAFDYGDIEVITNSSSPSGINLVRRTPDGTYDQTTNISFTESRTDNNNVTYTTLISDDDNAPAFVLVNSISSYSETTGESGFANTSIGTNLVNYKLDAININLYFRLIEGISSETESVSSFTNYSKYLLQASGYFPLVQEVYGENLESLPLLDFSTGGLYVDYDRNYSLSRSVSDIDFIEADIQLTDTHSIIYKFNHRFIREDSTNINTNGNTDLPPTTQFEGWFPPISEQYRQKKFYLNRVIRDTDSSTEEEINYLNSYFKGIGNLAFYSLKDTFSSTDIADNADDVLTTTYTVELNAGLPLESVGYAIYTINRTRVEDIIQQTFNTDYYLVNEDFVVELDKNGSFYFELDVNMAEAINLENIENEFPKQLVYSKNDIDGREVKGIDTIKVEYPLKYTETTTTTRNVGQFPSVVVREYEITETLTDPYRVDPEQEYEIDLVFFTADSIYKIDGNCTVAYEDFLVTGLEAGDYVEKTVSEVILNLTGYSKIKYHALKNRVPLNSGQVYTKNNCLALINRLLEKTDNVSLYKKNDKVVFTFSDFFDPLSNKDRYVDIYRLEEDKFVRKGEKKGKYFPVKNPSNQNPPNEFFISYFGDI